MVGGLLLCLTLLLLVFSAHARAAGPTRPAPPSTPTTAPAKALLHGYPQLYQQHVLSCEAATASMATGGRISEARILAAMPFNPNPWLGFRGNLDGGETLSNHLADYGIYAPPLARVMQSFGYQTTVISGTMAPQLLRYSIGVLHRPVEVWITRQLVYEPAITGHTSTGRFKLVLGEHARLVVGYDAGGIYTHDPDDGELYDPWVTFLRSWGEFNDMALILTPPPPAPPTGITAGIAGPGKVRWTWQALPGLLYRVSTWRYRGGHVADARTTLVGATGDYTLSVAPDQTFYLSARAIDLAGDRSAPTPPYAAPTIKPVRILTPPRGRLLPHGYGLWQWTATGAVRYQVTSWAYAGSQPIDRQSVTTVAPRLTRRLHPGVRYHLMVRAIGNDGTSTIAVIAPGDLLVPAAHRVQGLTVRRTPSGWLHWSWTAQPGVLYRVTLLRYLGPVGTVVFHTLTGNTELSTPPSPPHAADYLQVWAVDAAGDTVGPAQLHGA
jgi:uncharacterized protein YvpB